MMDKAEIRAALAPFLESGMSADDVRAVMESLQPAKRGRRVKYPWEALAVGDSFRAEGGNVRTLAPLACRMARKTGKRFTVKRGEGAVIVERIA